MVGYTEAIRFDGLSATRGSDNPQIRNGTSASVYECVRCTRYDLLRMLLDENTALYT
jgi:hypothetical protein